MIRHFEDHPRACGEKALAHRNYRVWAGSPPRMRGKVKGVLFMSCKDKDHPRACGEKLSRQYDDSPL